MKDNPSIFQSSGIKNLGPLCIKSLGEETKIYSNFFLDLHPSKNLSTLKDNIFIHMCINKNLAYGMCSIYCSYIKLSLSAGENANSLMLQCNSNCVYLFLIKCITCPMQ